MSSVAPVQQPAVQNQQGWRPRNFDEIQKDVSGLEQGKDYQIQSGDTLSSIAQALKAQHNLKQGIPEIVEELRKTNGIQDANKIQAGKPLSVEAALRNLKGAEEGQPQAGGPQEGQPAEGGQPQGQQQRTPTVNREQLMNYVQTLQQMGYSNEEIMQMLQRQGIIAGGQQQQPGSPQATPQPETPQVQPGRQNQPILV